MQLTTFLLLHLLPLTVNGINIVQSNDDGWAEKNIRVFYRKLTDSGFQSIISAPAENQSGRSSLDAPPTTVDDDGCEFNSCPAGSPATGHNASMPRFNYVNSYPVTSMKYGIQEFSQKFFGERPDIAVAGPNVGANLGLTTLLSGTVGAATEASKEGIPGIAFSGTSGDQTAWNASVETYMKVYADLSTTVTSAIADSGLPYLPRNVWLNVNYAASDETSCSSASDFKFVLSRIHIAIPFVTSYDVTTCGNGGRLPTESSVVGTDGCYASISVGVADTKLDANAKQQRIVLNKLKIILSCLPS